MALELQDALVALIVGAAALYLWRRHGPRPRRKVVAVVRASSLKRRPTTKPPPGR